MKNKEKNKYTLEELYQTLLEMSEDKRNDKLLREIACLIRNDRKSNYINYKTKDEKIESFKEKKIISFKEKISEYKGLDSEGNCLEDLKYDFKEAVIEFKNEINDLEDDEMNNSELEIKYRILDKFKDIFGDFEK